MYYRAAKLLQQPLVWIKFTFKANTQMIYIGVMLNYIAHEIISPCYCISIGLLLVLAFHIT